VPGKHPSKLELKCRACGILCYRDAGRRWVHETDPPEPHDPVVRWFGAKNSRAAGVPPGDAPPRGDAAPEDEPTAG
jgi:hypothetical protein